MKNEDKDYILLNKADFDKLREWARKSDYVDDTFDDILNNTANMNSHFAKELKAEFEEEQKYADEAAQQALDRREKVEALYRQYPVGSRVFIKSTPFNFTGIVVTPGKCPHEEEPIDASYIWVRDSNGKIDYFRPDQITTPEEADEACEYSVSPNFANCIQIGYRKNVIDYLQNNFRTFFENELCGTLQSYKTTEIAKQQLIKLWKDLYNQGYVTTDCLPAFGFSADPLNYSLVFYWNDNAVNTPHTSF